MSAAHSYQSVGVRAQTETQVPQSAGRILVREAIRLASRERGGIEQKGAVEPGLEVSFQKVLIEKETTSGKGRPDERAISGGDLNF